MKISLSLLLACTALLSLSATAACKVADITAKDVTVLAGPTGQTTTAGYAHFTNSGSDNCEIIGATSPIAKEVQLHTVSQTNGMMKMQPVTEFTIPAKGELLLAPNGNHLMFMQLTKELKPNESVPVTLKFKDGEEMKIMATAQDMRETPKVGQ